MLCVRRNRGLLHNSCKKGHRRSQLSHSIEQFVSAKVFHGSEIRDISALESNAMIGYHVIVVRKFEMANRTNPVLADNFAI